MERKELLKHIPSLLVGTLALGLCAVVNPINHYACALMLTVCAVAMYFYTAFIPGKRNWWDIRALFSAIWLFTIGLACLRLTDYQRPWETATWLLVAASYALFYAGATLGIRLGQKCYARCKRGISIKNFTFRLQGQRLFWICFGVTVFCICCFAANIALRGYIPYFARSGDTYVGFYSKFYIFCTAGTGISGLSYYTLKTQKLSAWQKIFLWFSIVYSTFLYPMLVVSRGMFLTAALSLTTVVFYLNKRRFLLLVLSIAVIGAFYMEGTKARGYSEDQLNAFFEPSVIAPDKEDSDSTDPSSPTETPGETPNENPGFQLSGSAAFIYSYLTVSHDNFNEAVRTVDTYTYGLRQLLPFNVILRIGAIDKTVEEVGHNFVRPHLNTTNLVGEAYYDFGAIGVILLMLLWAIAFGMIQGFALESDGPFGLMALGNTMTPVALCFFESWMSIFSHWMHWGFVLILFLLATVTKNHKDKGDF